MKLHHAAALALVGWYLLVPAVRRPTKTSPALITKLTAPFRFWTIQNAFDSAQPCIAARDALTQQAKEHLAWMETEEGKRALQKAPERDLMILVTKSDSYAECIATDDPRLKE